MGILILIFFVIFFIHEVLGNVPEVLPVSWNFIGMATFHLFFPYGYFQLATKLTSILHLWEWRHLFAKQWMMKFSLLFHLHFPGFMSGKRMVHRNSHIISTIMMDVLLSLLVYMTVGQIVKVLMLNLSPYHVTLLYILVDYFENL